MKEGSSKSSEKKTSAASKSTGAHKAAPKTGSSASRSRGSEIEDKETTGGSHITTDHEKIRQWAEERRGVPSCVRGTGGKGDIGMLRINFPGYSGEESLEEISWDEWFEKFDERNLALLYQDETAKGQKSNFNKLISRDTAETARAPKTRKAGGR